MPQGVHPNDIYHKDSWYNRNGEKVAEAADVMVGATSTVPGVSGAVPAPGPSKRVSLLKGDGTWTAGLTETAGGYVGLGAGAPNIRIKKLTGTAAAVNGATQLNHGLTQTKILSFRVQILDTNGNLVGPGYSAAASEFSTYVSTTQVVISIGPTATQIAGRPITVLLIYEE